MTLNGAMRVSASGMTAERFRLDVISANIANANSTGVNGQAPYRARNVRLVGDESGVRIAGVVEDQREFRRVSDPGNPMADADGFVTYSNVEPIEQMVDMLGASRAYEANVAAFNSARSMVRAAFAIGRNA